MDRQVEISKGDLLISHKGQYHYLVEYMNGNKIGLFWLHRKTGEPSRLYTYRKEVNFDRAPSDYDVITSEVQIRLIIPFVYFNRSLGVFLLPFFRFLLLSKSIILKMAGD